MMPDKIAIVSQGPSAKLWTGDRSGYDVVIGVNAVITLHACDLWVFSDWGAFVHPINDGRSGRWCDLVIGNPAIWTKGGNMTKLLSQNESVTELAKSFEWHDLSECKIPPFPNAGISWMRQGGLAALGVAWSLKPKRVDCFGCDMGGLIDALGLPPHHHSSRSDFRWSRERMCWTEMVNRMAAQGTEVLHSAGGGEFRKWTPDPEEKVNHQRRWVYGNEYGWVTYSFQAATEDDFRRKLAKMIGKTKAQRVKVKAL